MKATTRKETHDDVILIRLLGRLVSWPGLIESAVKRCATLDEAVERRETFDQTVQWCQMVRNMLALQDPSMLLAAAELVEQRLREHNELGRWLSDTFQPLQPEDSTVIRLLERLVSWGVPLVTTNYDGLIEAVTNLGDVCWTAPPARENSVENPSCFIAISLTPTLLSGTRPAC